MSRTIELDTALLPPGLGAAKPVELPATRYRQGGREMFHLVTTLAGLTQIVVNRPDPNRLIEGNRRVNATRARKFGTYLLQNDTWVSPAIIVRAPSGEINFTAVQQFDDGTAWGVLSIPLHVLSEILLLDGQHRTLGTFMAIDEINARIAKVNDTRQAAERNQDQGVVAEQEQLLEREKMVRERLTREHISVDLAVVETATAKQMFADINNNAKGVNPDYTTYLDQREVVNRIAVDLIEEHQLLAGRVEIGQATRMSASNPNLIGAKTVADIVRAVHLGAKGRIGNRVYDEMTRNQRAATMAVRNFLDLLLAAFDDLRAVAEGRLEPVELRKQSMLGSATMLRVLAAVYHDLTRVPQRQDGPALLTRSEVHTFFKSLEPHMKEIPVRAADEFWMTTGAFLPDTSAPQARRQSIVQLTEELVKRGREMGSAGA